MISLDHGSMTSWGVALYNACNGTVLLCESGPTAPIVVSVAASTEYLVRVFSDLGQGTGGAFSICISSSVLTHVTETTANTLGAVNFGPDGALVLEWSGTVTIGHIQLLDLRGRKLDDRRIGLIPGTNGPMMLAAVSPGVYLLRLDAGGTTITRRLTAE